VEATASKKSNDQETRQQDTRQHPARQYVAQKPELRRYEQTYYQENSPIPCPECGSRAVYRLHRSSLEKLATAVSGHYPYFCRNCYAKFYKREKADNV
jgi:DNA-directed RNA polymerase subunit RPC12/RpoP